MGNWSYLAANRTPNPNYLLDWVFAYEEIQIIMAAKYALPPLWHGLFLQSERQICSLTFEDGETLSHPVYMTSAEMGIQRAIDRRSKICSMFPENIESVYDQWLGLLQLFKGDYIQMDWSDLADMGDESEREKMNLRVQAGVRAFESDDANDWDACFGTSSVVFDKETKRVSLNPHTKKSTASIHADLYGYHFIKKENKNGKPEWTSEVEEHPQGKK